MANWGRDPRLAELEFLAYLARQQSHVNVQRHLPTTGELAELGLTQAQWTDLILHLLAEGLIQHSTMLFANKRVPQHHHTDLRTQDGMNAFAEGEQLSISATHKGRVRLWDLMDQFAAARRLHALGVIYAKEGCAPDYDVAQAQRAPNQAIALVALDVDWFKQVNDTLGHTVGDEVLRRVFTTIKNTVGRSGNVYSYGGDEVAVVIHATQENEAKKLAEQIRQSVQQEFEGKGKLAKVKKQPTVSVGVLVLKRRASFKEAYEAADALSRESKEAGKNKVHLELWD